MSRWFFSSDGNFPTGDLRDIFLQGTRASSSSIRQAVQPAVEIEPAVIQEEYEGENDADDEGGDEGGDEDEKADDDSSLRASGTRETGAPAGPDEAWRMQVEDLDGSGEPVRRKWTEEEEVAILQGFLDFRTRQQNAEPFYEQIKKQLQLDFTEPQLTEILRRFKKKYQGIADRLAPVTSLVFQNAHDRDCFELCRKIWRSGTKRPLDGDEDVPASPIGIAVRGAPSTERGISGSSGRRLTAERGEPSASISTPGNVEETMKRLVMNVVKELMQLAMSGSLVGGFVPGIGVGIVGMNLNTLQTTSKISKRTIPADENWKKQHILELEVYLKRVELVLDQIKATLEKVKSENPTSRS